jgi:hypothetical protein
VVTRCTGHGRAKWHPQLLLCEPDVEDEDELRFVQTHGAGLFEIGVLVDGSRGKRGWSDTPFGRADTRVSVLYGSHPINAMAPRLALLAT